MMNIDKREVCMLLFVPFNYPGRNKVGHVGYKYLVVMGDDVLIVRMLEGTMFSQYTNAAVSPYNDLWCVCVFVLQEGCYS